ncbi:MAG: hypothetical protein J3T61_09750, partial [Candidatus Brocadiales bacterium]|nr:hypothetical protein [Candidatus Bathyanammoxibius sp.]
MPKFDFILRGHEHSVKALGLNDLASSNQKYYMMSAGALYKHPKHPNSFNVTRLNLDRGEGVIFVWRYFRRSRKWDKDVDFASEGFKQFELHEELQKQI